MAKSVHIANGSTPKRPKRTIGKMEVERIENPDLGFKCVINTNYLTK
jgi:hypothetical protein